MAVVFVDLRQNRLKSHMSCLFNPKFFGFCVEGDFLMLRLVKGAVMVGMVAGALSLAGCATQESVEHAQASADHAMAQAQTATSAAQRAQSTADGDASAAAAAQGDATKANTRLDTVESSLDHLMHHHEHATWKDVGVKHKHHGHRMPKTGTENPAPATTK